jgi:hypothetical protein
MNRAIAAVIAGSLSLAIGSLANAQPVISRSVSASAGERVTAGAIVLQSTLGETVVGAATAGAFILESGYWWATLGAAVDVPAVETLPAEPRWLGLGPNPFARSLSLGFALPRETAVLLEVFNVQGRRVRTLSNERLGPGRHDLRWDGTDGAGNELGSGIYWVRLRAGSLELRRKIVRLE